MAVIGCQHKTMVTCGLLPQNPSLSNVSCEQTHCPWSQTLFTMTQTPLSRQGPLRRPLAT